MGGDASTAGTPKLHRYRQKADPLFRSRYAALNPVYNFVRIRQTLKVTPAMAAVTSRICEMGDVVDVLEAWEQARMSRAV
jgi:hypothetical protein